MGIEHLLLRRRQVHERVTDFMSVGSQYKTSRIPWYALERGV